MLRRAFCGQLRNLKISKIIYKNREHSSPFFNENEKSKIDRTTSAEKQYLLQEKVIRFERFKDVTKDGAEEYSLYDRTGETR